MISGKSIKQEPWSITIDLDWYGYEFSKGCEEVTVLYKDKKYVAKLSDLIDAFVSNGLFKVVDE